MLIINYRGINLSIFTEESSDFFNIIINSIDSSNSIQETDLPEGLKNEFAIFFENINLVNKLKSESQLKFKLKKKGFLSVQEHNINNRSSYLNLGFRKTELLLPYIANAKFPSEIMNFQLEGIDWLRNIKGGILADDMGLGKTVQAVLALKSLFIKKYISKVVILCPKSLLKNWASEFDKWASEIPGIILTPPSNLKNEAWEVCFSNTRVAITNYDSFRKLPEYFNKNKIDLLICDEAHRLRISSSQIYNSIKKINSEYIWMLSGSPIEKDAKDLSTLLSIIQPHNFSSMPTNIQLESQSIKAKYFIKRRLKSDMLKELPKVYEYDPIKIKLSNNQAKSYQNLLLNVQENKPRRDILSVLNKLMSISDYDPETKESSKLEEIKKEIIKIKKLDDKVIVFSYLIEPLKILKQKIQESGVNSVFFDGQLNSNEREMALKKFKESPDITCFLCSMKAGGEGLTLTEANHVIFINRWWNPSTNNQARDRVIRLGQKKEVHVKYFISQGTLEENLSELLDNKEEIFIRNIENQNVLIANKINEEQIWKKTALQLKLL